MTTARWKTKFAIVVMSLVGLAQRGFSLSSAPVQKTRIGDMIFKEGEFEIEHEAAESSRASLTGGPLAQTLVTIRTRPWPNGRLPIEFDSEISVEEKHLFFSACLEWSLRANVHCVADAKASVRIRVAKGDGCSSEVGYGSENTIERMLPGKREELREMSLADGCWNKKNITHEIGHALGLTHEHQRPDRDEYIKVLWDNIKSGRSGNFTRVRGTFPFDGSALPLGLPYDFKSIMHYREDAFGKDGLQSWVPQSGYEDAADSAGLARLPSYLDGKTVRMIYGEPSLISRGVPRE